MSKSIDYEVEQKGVDLGGGGSATRQNKETKPSWWQRVYNWFINLFK